MRSGRPTPVPTSVNSSNSLSRWASWPLPASVWVSACMTRRSRFCAGLVSRTTCGISAIRRSVAPRCCASEPRRSPADPTCRSSKPRYGPVTVVSRSAASRNSCRCLRSPTTSWWWPAASTTIRPVGTAMSRSWPCRPHKSACRPPTARSVRDRWIPPRSASTPGYRPMHWLRGPARGWQPSVGDWLMSGCRSPGRSQRRVNGRSESPWPA
ncbi:Uncharacterised protein [Mycobacterium tuberculosis]|uniref:Uncharacterized protein n=1 Tax=Mycobacterium tuberculosis TaxID=1773 RepID=A0A655A5U4_MYCTX|nr:Uncharacterised protein [Mycobacterium tuberculosis]CKR92757.1 Uncharacterised protein [Mycobacterium tuberculosis]